MDHACQKGFVELPIRDAYNCPDNGHLRKKLGWGQEGGEERITPARGYRSNLLTLAGPIGSGPAADNRRFLIRPIAQVKHFLHSLAATINRNYR